MAPARGCRRTCRRDPRRRCGVAAARFSSLAPSVRTIRGVAAVPPRPACSPRQGRREREAALRRRQGGDGDHPARVRDARAEVAGPKADVRRPRGFSKILRARFCRPCAGRTETRPKREARAARDERRSPLAGASSSCRASPPSTSSSTSARSSARCWRSTRSSSTSAARPTRRPSTRGSASNIEAFGPGATRPDVRRFERGHPPTRRPRYGSR